jgi:selenocysteine lyase/cysteine desulfurase
MDISQIRKLTPGISDHIHFNNAGSSLPTQATLNSIFDYLQEEALIGGYTMQAKHATAIAESYRHIGEMIHAPAHAIAITSNASSAFSRALLSTPWKSGDTLLTSELEYGNNYLSFLHLKEKYGIGIRLIPHDDSGCPNPLKVESLLDDSIKLVAITHMPTNSGKVTDVEAIGKITRKYGIPYLVDACQTVGQIPLDVDRIGCDFLSATSRKYLRGPRGMGFLYINPKILQRLAPPFLDMNAAVWTGENSYTLEKSSQMFEEWEKAYALQIGFGTAAAYFNQLGHDACWQRIQDLASYARAGLTEIKGVEVHDTGKVLGGIIGFSKKGLDPEKVKTALQQQGITSSVSYASSSWMDMNKNKLQAVNRASLHYFNIHEEVDTFLKVVQEMKD